MDTARGHLYRWVRVRKLAGGAGLRNIVVEVSCGSAAGVDIAEGLK